MSVLECTIIEEVSRKINRMVIFFLKTLFLDVICSIKNIQSSFFVLIMLLHAGAGYQFSILMRVRV